MKITAATEHAHAADRFAREIIAILTAFVVRLRRLMGRPLARTIILCGRMSPVNEADSQSKGH